MTTQTEEQGRIDIEKALQFPIFSCNPPERLLSFSIHTYASSIKKQIIWDIERNPIQNMGVIPERYWKSMEREVAFQTRLKLYETALMYEISAYFAYKIDRYDEEASLIEPDKDGINLELRCKFTEQVLGTNLRKF